jgi:hypothetical protein
MKHSLLAELLPSDLVWAWNRAKRKQASHMQVFENKQREKELKDLGFRKAEIK